MVTEHIDISLSILAPMIAVDIDFLIFDIILKLIVPDLRPRYVVTNEYEQKARDGERCTKAFSKTKIEECMDECDSCLGCGGFTFFPQACSRNSSSSDQSSCRKLNCYTKGRLSKIRKIRDQMKEEKFYFAKKIK